jgi:hypothetical protein
VGTPFAAPNNRFGADQAIPALLTLLSQHGYSHLEVAQEATGLFWFHFHTTLQKSPILAPFPSNLVIQPQTGSQVQRGP